MRFILIFVCFLHISINAQNKQDMTFSIYKPCDGQGHSCVDYILADGVITKDTPNKFIKFQKEHANDHGGTLYLNSMGGDLNAGIILGKLIRLYEYNTFVGEASHVDFNYPAIVYGELNPKRYLTIIKNARCFSACTYAFMGGIIRKIDWRTSKFGVHQFYTINGKSNEEETQRIYSKLSLYLDEMKVSRKLLNLASLKNKSEIFYLTSQQAKDLKVTNWSGYQTKWELSADNKGVMRVCSIRKLEGYNFRSLLCFSKRKKPKELTAHFIALPSYMDKSEAVSRLTLEDKSQACPSLSFSMEKYPGHMIYNCTNWSILDDRIGYYKAFVLNKRLVRKLLSNNKLNVNFAFSNANLYLDPSTSFSTDGINSLVKAIIKP